MTQRDRYRDRMTGRQRNRETGKQREHVIARKRDRQKETERETDSTKSSTKIMKLILFSTKACTFCNNFTASFPFHIEFMVVL